MNEGSFYEGMGHEMDSSTVWLAMFASGVVKARRCGLNPWAGLNVPVMSIGIEQFERVGVPHIAVAVDGGEE